MPTKYARQIATAERLIRKFGTTCVWSKEDTDNASTLPPEMRPMSPELTFAGVPIVFIPATRKEQFTSILQVMNATVLNQDVAFIPGTIAFIPENGDYATLDGVQRYVDRVNRIAPDNVAIAYEITFK